eukprot:scaffold24746_cov71-Skeletonema_marinoi.AAC.2
MKYCRCIKPVQRTAAISSKDIMADHANDGDEGDGGGRDIIFVYRGGRAPRNVTHVRIDKSVEVIEDYAFNGCKHLVQVETHDRIRKVGKKALSSIEFSGRLETIERYAFDDCDRLRRIAIPLKRDLFPIDPHQQECSQFHCCNLLTTVDLVGGAHKTIASLHMESWRIAMKEEINRINQDLRDRKWKTVAIKRWMKSVIDKMEYYKAEHHRYVKEAVTLLELAHWKAKLAEKEENAAAGRTNAANIIDAESVRKEKRITCGADTVIKNVIPFLKLE